jgi:peptide/nickel transport system permease protein
MLKYIIKRILIFIPTLIAISLITFVISINAPGDPVDTILNKKSGGEAGQAANKNAVDESAYISLRHKLGLDLPLFYCSLTNATNSDTLYRIPKADVRSNLEHLSYIYGNWPYIASYYSVIKGFAAALAAENVKGPAAESVTQAKTYVNSLLYIYDYDRILNVIQKLEFCVSNSPELQPLTANVNALKNALNDILLNRMPMQKYIPVIHWYGLQNQYHHWLVNFIKGDYGISYQDMRPVGDIVWNAVKWTMGISFASIILSYLLAVPLGVGSAIRKGSRREKVTTTGLFMLYSLPNFWIATILIIFLCGGDWLSWFPAPGEAPIPSDAPFMYQLSQGLYRLILPLICWTYTALAFISRQMRGGMLNVIGQDFIRTARAKGVSENVVIWKHALRNSLLPIITLFANVFPLMISGSVVIETIFSIPGMGQISFNALLANDYPVVFTDTMFAAILTLLGTLIADILYALVDPRISFAKITA